MFYKRSFNSGRSETLNSFAKNRGKLLILTVVMSSIGALLPESEASKKGKRPLKSPNFSACSMVADGRC